MQGFLQWYSSVAGTESAGDGAAVLIHVMIVDAGADASLLGTVTDSVRRTLRQTASALAASGVHGRLRVSVLNDVSKLTEKSVNDDVVLVVPVVVGEKWYAAVDAVTKVLGDTRFCTAAVCVGHNGSQGSNQNGNRNGNQSSAGKWRVPVLFCSVRDAAAAVSCAVTSCIPLLLQLQKQAPRSPEALDSSGSPALELHRVIEMLADLIESRSDETGGHVMRVASLVYCTARHLGLPEDVAYTWRVAALLHDVGKIGIPDGILHKPGKLTAEEFEVMKRHTVIGYQILSKGPGYLFRVAASIALNHHENWDGTGYPNGLSGTLIPLEARITAVADVYDALTSNRSYRTAWPDEVVRQYIRNESGHKFDPHVVEAFLAVLDRCKEHLIRDAFSFPYATTRPMGHTRSSG